MDRRVTTPKGVTSPTWGPPPACKQTLSFAMDDMDEIFLSVLDST